MDDPYTGMAVRPSTQYGLSRSVRDRWPAAQPLVLAALDLAKAQGRPWRVLVVPLRPLLETVIPELTEEERVALAREFLQRFPELPPMGVAAGIRWPAPDAG